MSVVCVARNNKKAAIASDKKATRGGGEQYCIEQKWIEVNVFMRTSFLGAVGDIRVIDIVKSIDFSSTKANDIADYMRNCFSSEVNGKFGEDEDRGFLACDANKIMHYTKSCTSIADNYHAIGSGSKAALGAMNARSEYTNDVIEIVRAGAQAACEHDRGCGGNIALEVGK